MDDNLKNIKAFLERFKKLTPPHDSTKKTVIQIIQSYTNVTLEKDNIAIQGHTVFLKNISPHLRTAVYMKKGALLTELNSTLKTSFKDIR